MHILLAEPGVCSMMSHTNKCLLPKKSRQADRGVECNISKSTVNLYYILILKAFYFQYNLAITWKEPDQILQLHPLQIHKGKDF